MKKEIFYTTGALMKATGIPKQTVTLWIAEKVIKPSQLGGGIGNHHLFSRMDVIAIGYAYLWRTKGDVGLTTTKSIVRLIHKYTEEELRDVIREGYSTVIVGPGIESDLLKGRPYVQDNDYTLGSIYSSIISKLDDK
jgi:DNA-binding transcriptional MerR regulator